MGQTVQFRATLLALLFTGASALSACDSGPSALPARDHSQAALDQAAAAVSRDPATQTRTERAVRTATATPLYRGKPIWSSNQKYSAQENVDYHFKRDGAAFGASTPDDYVAKAHAFIEAPPKGALTLKRKNGDLLIYDPKDNVFAVATSEGAPRTMFKPDNGMDYWNQQKAREAKTASAGKGDDKQG